MSSSPRIGALPRTAYRQYIQSPAWRKKRELYLQSKLSNDCAGCGATYTKGFHLHHRTYKNLGVERLMDLIMLCPKCHDKVHQAQQGNLWAHTKRTLKIIKRKS